MRTGSKQPALHGRGASHKAKRDSSNADYSKAEFMKTPQSDRVGSVPTKLTINHCKLINC